MLVILALVKECEAEIYESSRPKIFANSSLIVKHGPL